MQLRNRPLTVFYDHGVRRESESRLAALARREVELEAARAELDRSAQEDAERGREDSRRALAGALEEFRAVAEREIASIQDAKERARVERAQMRAEGRVRAELRDRQNAVAPPSGSGRTPPPEPAPTR